MNMKKKFFYLLVVVLLICSNVSFAVAANVGIMASPTFVTKSAGLSTAMKATMTASTSVICEKIFVSSVVLQKKSGTNWVDDQSLPCPTTTVTKGSTFGTSKDYSSYCTKGNTYRVVITFNADGVTASATSGSATYN